MKLMTFTYFRNAILTAFLCGSAVSAQQLGDTGAIPFHLDQADIEAGRVTFAPLIEYGDLLFRAVFNKYDGAGRPGSTGTGAARVPDNAPAMIRTSGPDANSCVGCHNQPRVGGAGDFVVNVFVLSIGESKAVFLRGVGGDAATEPRRTGFGGIRKGIPKRNFGTHRLTLCHFDATLRNNSEAQAYWSGDLQTELKNRGVDAIVCTERGGV